MQIAPMDSERHVPFEGCFNFRDLGGYETADGRRIRSRRLFRADGPHALTDTDHTTLRGLELATVIDLRTPGESEERGRFEASLDAVTAYSLPLLDVLPDAEELPTWIDPAVVARRYLQMVGDASASIAEVLAILSDPDAYPAMFHCSAGKDRTGVLAAIVLGALGVPDDTIVADYALSQEPMNKLVDHLLTVHPDAAPRLRQLAPAMVAAAPETMALFVAGIRAEYGDFEGYARALDVETAPEFLRAALLT